MTTIVIDTKPSNAKLSLDDRYIGLTPIEISDVIPGEYTYTLDLDGYNIYYDGLDVYPNKVTHIFVDLETGKKHEEFVGNVRHIKNLQNNVKENLEIFEKGGFEGGVGRKASIPSKVIPSNPIPNNQSESEHNILVQHLDDMNKILSKNNDLMETNNSLISDLTTLMDTLRQYVSKTSGFDVSEKYFSTEQIAITVSTPVKPDNPDQIADPNTVPPTPGYDKIDVHSQMNRNSRNISVINDGTFHLFVLTSPDGQRFSSQENPILVGESRIFHNIWEMRIRSASSGDLTTGLGGIYRVTEYDYSLSYSSTVLSGTVNRPSFVSRIVNAPLAGTNLPNIPIANGFALTMRANVNNGLGFVYVADSIPDSINPAVPGFRITLAAGDVARLFITNANLVAIAGSTGAENVDILVET